MQARLQSATLGSSIRAQCPLYLDILEAILHEHRFDTHTLAQCALVSRTMLQLARKVLYRSVSLDQSENPYASDQQHLLRTSLANNPHLCRYIHILSLPMSTDRVLTKVMDQLTKVEILHVISGGSCGDVAEQQHYHHQPSAGGTSGALTRLFGLASLRKVTLEGYFPFSDIDLSAFSELKDLEISFPWGVDLRLHEEGQLYPKHSHRAHAVQIQRTPTVKAPRACARVRRTRLHRLSLKLPALGPISRWLYGEEVSNLREFNVDVSSTDDSDGLWDAVARCSHSLEVLTVRQLHADFGSVCHPTMSVCFSNLHTLVLGIPAFSPMEDPFRPLLRLLSHPSTHASTNQSSRFPSLRTLKIIVDLWGCEAANLPWRTVCSYRGWGELDDVLALGLTSEGSHPTVTFEIQSSCRYKEFDGHAVSSESTGLLSLLLSELHHLRHYPSFSIL